MTKIKFKLELLQFQKLSRDKVGLFAFFIISNKLPNIQFVWDRCLYNNFKVEYE